MGKIITEKARLMAKTITGPITGRFYSKKTQTAEEYLNKGTVSALSTEMEDDAKELVKEEACRIQDRRYGTTPATLNPNEAFRARKRRIPMTTVQRIENADRIARNAAERRHKGLAPDSPKVKQWDPNELPWEPEHEDVTITHEDTEDTADPLSEDDSLWDADELLDDVEDED